MIRGVLFGLLLFVLVPPLASRADAPGNRFRKDVKPLLTQYCSDCHADGEKKGNVSFDEFKSDADLVGDHDLWLKVVKNVRAGLMPPAKKARPTAEEIRRLEGWVKYDAFGLDPKDPDPGRVTVRRLNRTEYRNTIRHLMGIEVNTEVEFPPDDTGYGFDNIGDVLTMSPLLLERYLAVAKIVVTEAVPVVSKVVQERTVTGNRFQAADGKPAANDRRGIRKETFLALPYYESGAATHTYSADQSGSYRLTLELAVKGAFDFDPGRCQTRFKLDDQEVLQKEFGWYDNKTFRFDIDQMWDAGPHRFSFELEPLTPKDKQIQPLEMRIVSVTVRGPLEVEHWTRPKNYDRFFTKDPPSDPQERRAYARQILGDFTRKANRRPADPSDGERLAKLAENISNQPGKTFEAGIAHAMMAVLASPQFLFRLEESEPGSGANASSANVDEYSLASRLSYFLWSTMPDETLFELAGRGELRRNLTAQVKRMLADPRSEKMIQNFTGQWLQTRDVEGIAINARAVFARDTGTERQMRQQLAEFRARFAQRTNAVGAATNQMTLTNLSAQGNGPAATNGTSGTNAFGRGNRQRLGFNRGRFAPPPVELDRDLREAMLKETDLFFADIVREDRPVTQLIDSDYTYLNEKLAKVYGMTNLDVKGAEMRKVSLPADSPRGGVLTHGSVLVVTSNPDRTSPVKRGLFVLENILGTPAPPPPGNVPALEASEKDFKDPDRDPTLREALALHRDKPLCASCHARMDPIGLAFENFNALGMWREKERGQTIETPGKLLTGETFNNVRALKQILAKDHRLDFYRCLTEKFLTYALGRGLEYYDLETIDQIVARLEREDGRFSALLMGIIESAPFQKQRKEATPVTADSAKPVVFNNPPP